MYECGWHQTSQISCALVLVLVTALLGGCLLSTKPLITVGNASYPLGAGTIVEWHKLSPDGKLTPEVDSKTGKVATMRVEVKSGKYFFHDAASGTTGSPIGPVLMHRIGDSRFYVAMLAMPDQQNTTLVYDLIEAARDGHLVVYGIGENAFSRYNTHMQATDPVRWARIANGQWRVRVQAMSVEVSSLAFLEKTLPDMASKGFHSPERMVLKPVN
jgi:hypothetical protein